MYAFRHISPKLSLRRGSCQLVADLLYGFATGKLRGNWCDGFRHLRGTVAATEISRTIFGEHSLSSTANLDALLWNINTRAHSVSVYVRVFLMTMSDTGGNRRSLTRSSQYLQLECLEFGLVRAMTPVTTQRQNPSVRELFLDWGVIITRATFRGGPLKYS